LEAGIPLKVVSEYLGHANISITADVYQHVTDEMARRAGDALGGIILPLAESPDGAGSSDFPRTTGMPDLIDPV
jgi:hypothetical protein